MLSTNYAFYLFIFWYWSLQIVFKASVTHHILAARQIDLMGNSHVWILTYTTYLRHRWSWLVEFYLVTTFVAMILRLLIWIDFFELLDPFVDEFTHAWFLSSFCMQLALPHLLSEICRIHLRHTEQVECKVGSDIGLSRMMTVVNLIKKDKWWGCWNYRPLKFDLHMFLMYS